VRWDPVLKRYVCDAKFVYGQAGKEAGEYDDSFRTRGISTSKDLIHWTPPRMTIYPDALDDADAQIYGHISFPYESMWLGMLRVYHFARTGWKQVDIELTASRDGTNWSRVGNREIFLPLGGPESWERDYTDPAHSGPILVGDELWIYYRGSRNLKAEKDDWEFACGLAKLRRDGFVSIDAADQTGSLITRPLTYSGRALHLNARVAPGGQIRVGLLELEGGPIAGYGTEHCSPISGDSTDFEVSWDSGGNLSAARGSREQVRLKFELKNAQLYSFRIE
jgi:hypothetical protein